MKRIVIHRIHKIVAYRLKFYRLTAISNGNDYFYRVELARTTHHWRPVERECQFGVLRHIGQSRQCDTCLIVGLTKLQVVLLQIDGVSRCFL